MDSVHDHAFNAYKLPEQSLKTAVTLCVEMNDTGKVATPFRENVRNEDDAARATRLFTMPRPSD